MTKVARPEVTAGVDSSELTNPVTAAPAAVEMAGNSGGASLNGGSTVTPSACFCR